MAPSKVPSNIRSLVSKHDNLSIVETEYGKKLRCNLTNTDLKLDYEAIQKYLQSKKYKQASEKWYDDSWIETFLPHIVPHLRNPKKLYCKLTKKELNKVRAQVEKHVKGKRYKNRLQEYNKAVEQGEADAKLKLEKKQRKREIANAAEFDVPTEEKFAFLEAIAAETSDVESEVDTPTKAPNAKSTAKRKRKQPVAELEESEATEPLPKNNKQQGKKSKAGLVKKSKKKKQRNY